MKVFLYTALFGFLQTLLLLILVRAITKQRRWISAGLIAVKLFGYWFAIFFRFNRYLSAVVSMLCGYLTGFSAAAVLWLLYLSFVLGHEREMIAALCRLFHRFFRCGKYLIGLLRKKSI